MLTAESRRLIGLTHRRDADPCGTEAAHTRHLRRGEPIDRACRAAHRAHNAQRRAAAAALKAATARATAVLIGRHRREFAGLLAAALREGGAS